jgi:signal peptidase I
MTWLVVLGVAALSAGGCLWLRRSYVVVTVTGPSMQPTYHDGDRVLVRRRPLSVIRPGDVVVIARPDAAGWMIKRVVAVPGQAPPFNRVPSLSALAQSRVPDGTLVLLGDNPSYSKDSQRYGYLAADRLLGRVVRRFAAARGDGKASVPHPQTPVGDVARRSEPRGLRGGHPGPVPGPTAEGQHDAEVP